MHFDVMRDPWIDVVTATGEEQTLSIRELLLSAHALKAVRDISPLCEYGIYRLLIVMVMDMMRPDSYDDLEALQGSGRFSPSVVDAYIALCEKDGPCFDLFDEEKPFLQCKYDAELDEKALKPIAYLSYAFSPTSNNLHFQHAKIDDTIFSYSQSAKLLCASAIFANSGGRGYQPYINKAQPLYILMQGETLFTTIVCNCVASTSFQGTKYCNHGVAWHYGWTSNKLSILTEVAVLDCMLLRMRRIHLIPDGNGTVKEMHYSSGIGYDKETLIWRDPHVAYDRQGECVTPRDNDEIWRDICVIFGEGTASIPVQLCRNDGKGNDINIVAYALKADKAKVLSCVRAEQSFPSKLLHSGQLFHIISEVLMWYEKNAEYIEKAFHVFCSMLSKKTVKEGKEIDFAYHKLDDCISIAHLHFSTDIHAMLFHDMFTKLLSIEDMNSALKQNIYDEFAKLMIGYAQKAFSVGIEMMIGNARALQSFVETDQWLSNHLSRLRNQRRSDHAPD